MNLGYFQSSARYRVFVVSVLFCMILSIFFLIPVERIVLRLPENQGKLWCVWNDDHFRLKWRHSVEKQFWLEDYQQREGHLYLFQMYTQSFGAGVPSGGEVIDAPKGYIGLKTAVKIKELEWVVSSNMQGIVMLGKQIFPVYQLLPDYTSVQFSIERQPRIIWLFRVNCL